MKYSEIQKLDSHKLKDEIKKLSNQLGELQLKKSISVASVKDSSVFKKTRKLIAQHKFVLDSQK
jgi:ribosomal protein L29